MYNKIASIILNSGKMAGASVVFVAQPDSAKEKAAGKIFLLAEIGGKKSESEKILDFLISDLEENYYEDEKIALIGKIEGLKAENIFEAALAKTNKNLNEFLADHKIKINPETTSLTAGVVYENKLHFAGFGKNRSLLIYRRRDGFEIINVETEAKNSPDKEGVTKTPGLFSSVISGEVPLGSYFVFASESLPEYLSGREMVEIITKLPPIVAAEQIKNVLTKINSYIPFLGIIIKNTTDVSGKEIKEIPETPLSAQTSITSLNHTEQKTESMLAPAGLVNWQKGAILLKNILRNLRKTSERGPKRRGSLPSVKPKDVDSAKDSDSAPLRSPYTPHSAGPQFRPEEIKSEKTNIFNLPAANSFLRPEKIFLKKSSRRFLISLKKIIFSLPALLSFSTWRNGFAAILAWFRSLQKKHIFMLAGLVVVVLVLNFSLSATKNQRAREEAQLNFDMLVEEIEKKEALIDSYLLYNNEDGAARILIDAQQMVDSLPRDKDYQLEVYENLQGRLRILSDKAFRIEPATDLEQILEFTEDTTGLVYAGGKIYGARGDTVYSLDEASGETEAFKVEGATSLSDPKYHRVDNTDFIYYRAGSQLARLNLSTNNASLLPVSNFEESQDYTGFAIYSNNFYQAARAEDTIYRYSNFGVRSIWRSAPVEVRQASDIYIDGSIYALNRDGSIYKYHAAQNNEYQSSALKPSTTGANKMLGDDNQLYILDSASKRLAIVNKTNGALVSQRMFDNLPSLDDFALDADGRTIYLLSGTKIYKLGL